MVREVEWLVPVREFLVSNGFRELREGEWGNGLCVVRVENCSYEVESDNWLGVEGFGVMRGSDMSVYWLIGVLTWYGFIRREYV